MIICHQPNQHNYTIIRAISPNVCGCPRTGDVLVLASPRGHSSSSSACAVLATAHCVKCSAVRYCAVSNSPFGKWDQSEANPVRRAVADPAKITPPSRRSLGGCYTRAGPLLLVDWSYRNGIVVLVK